MRLHSAKVPQIATEMVDALVKGGDIETESPNEVKADIEAVLNQYIRDEQDVSDKAKDFLAQRGMGPNEINRIKKLMADERKIKIGEDAIDYLLDQLVEMLMHSGNVEEVFAEDYVLRRKMRDPLRKQLGEEQDLQAEVRERLKHVQEGTALWEVEYRRTLEDIKRRKGL
ncbi:MAG TPA: DUF507 family protein [Polyangiaceae bacterium]|jgi:hypothetical protein|nr:DUF507 family protein [Polyangiaceae bacterium]